MDFRQGHWCIFIPLGKVGIKMYKNKILRDGAYDNQSYAFRFGLAPCVYGKFNCNLSEDFKNFIVDDIGDRYCYLTEVIEIVQEYKNKEIEEIQKEYKKIGMDVSELWLGNLGKLGHKTILVDFDPMAVSVVP